jgi:hypothetical protein
VATYQDKVLTCSDCRGEFVWSGREQELYAEKGYRPPERCLDCKQAQRVAFERRGSNR